jgi:hypothetical protein
LPGDVGEAVVSDAPRPPSPCCIVPSTPTLIVPSTPTRIRPSPSALREPLPQRCSCQPQAGWRSDRAPASA